MINFDFSDAVNAKEAGSKLTPGIKEATFEGVEFANVTSQKTGDTFKVLVLKLGIDGYGPYEQNFFEPQSAERQEMQWGKSASQLDHFKITVMEILEAICPEVCAEINNGTKKLSGSFKQIVDAVATYTKPYIGKRTQVKLLPGKDGFCNMPVFTARIDRNGNLGIATRIIGDDLTLTNSEVKKIENAAAAKPTNMNTNTSDVISGMASDVDDDLPF